MIGFPLAVSGWYCCNHILAAGLFVFAPLPDRPRSADRTWSPAAISQKREYFKCPPETIGYSARELPKFGVWRHTASSQKPAVGGPF